VYIARAIDRSSERAIDTKTTYGDGGDGDGDKIREARPKKTSQQPTIVEKRNEKKEEAAAIVIMVSPVVAWTYVGIAAFLGLFAQQLVKPRLPVYHLRLRGVPLVTWLSGAGVAAKARAAVTMHNDNYLSMDVYGLAFDVYCAENWENGTLQRVGRLRDAQLALMESEYYSGSDDDGKNGSNITRSGTKPPFMDTRNPPPPIWQIGPRQEFASDNELYVELFGTRVLASPSILKRLAYTYYQGGGSLLMPITGVAYIKAASTTPFTITLVCDNLVNTWFGIEVHGVECALKQLKPGWADLRTTASNLRQYAVKHLRANSTGGVLQHPKKVGWVGQALQRFALDELLRIP